MNEDEEDRRDEARRNAFLLDTTRELLEALEAEHVRDPGDEVTETLTGIRLSVARMKARLVVDYLDRRKQRE